MAIYHLSAQTISRGKGQSAIASSAYRSGDKLYSERYGESNFYHREVKPITFILKPNHAPEWTLERERLWNEVEKAETNYNAQLAREFNIALPIEISHDEQEELVREYVQENFVNRGMVADVSIHRDDENNPHFHVMTTLRPFNPDGSWGKKSTKIYILDEKGNKQKTENGHVKSRKEYTTDWNDKETLQEWRKNWAEITNKYLKINGFQDRITEKSYAELGLETIPTIHEGYVARQMEKRGEKSDRCEKNRQINARNFACHNLEEKQEKQINNVRQLIHKEYADVTDNTKNVSNSLSPDEKKGLSDVAKNLKIYVTYENLIDKERMLNNWTDKVELNEYVNLENASQTTLDKINETGENIEKGKEILEQQADRIYNKYYPELAEVKPLGNYYKIKLANKTLEEDRVLEANEITTLIDEAKDEHINFMMKSIVKNPYIKRTEQYTGRLNELKKEKEQIKNELAEKGLTVQTASDKVKREYKDLLKETRTQIVTLKILNEYYSDTIKDKYPTFNTNDITVHEKQALSLALDYYGTDFSIHEARNIIEDNITNKYTYSEIIKGLNMINDIESGKIGNVELYKKYSNTKLNDVMSTVSIAQTRALFLEEAENKGFDTTHYTDYSKSPAVSKSALNNLFGKSGVLDSLYEAENDNIRREQQAERDRNKHKAKKKKTKKRKYREKPKYNTMKR